MRTTLAIDDDSYARLQREMRRRGCSFREIVNESLRRGLDQIARPAAASPYRLVPRPGGPRPGLSLERVEQLLDEVEGPLRR